MSVHAEQSRLTQAQLEEAVLQARQGFAYGALPDFGWLKIEGPDVFKFLQNRTSNDVLALQDGQGHLNAVLDRQAKVQGVFSLHRQGDALYLLTEREQIPNLVAQIEKFHILEQFSITDLSDTVVIFTVQGPNTDTFLTHCHSRESGNPFPVGEKTITQTTLFEIPVTLIHRSLTGQSGIIIVVESGLTEGFQNRFLGAAQVQQGVELTPDVLETLRIEAGIPKMYADLDPDTLLPGTGLEATTVSYSKGCYLGQETVARVKTYGAVQRALVGLLFPPEQHIPLPLPGAPIVLDGQEVGVIKSSTYSPTLKRPIAMVFLGKNERVPGRVLKFQADVHIYEATVTLLPFYREHGDSEEATLLLEKGLNQFAEGQDEAAIAILRKALELNPNLVQAYESLGVILARHDEIDEAMSLMHKVLELDPDHILAHTNLSIYWLKKGDKDKAEEEKAKATVAAMRKKAKEAGFDFDPEAERRKREKAAEERIGMFLEALKHSPDDPLGNFGLASAYLELRRYEEAIPALEKVLAAQPKHSVAYLSLGKALEGIKDLPRAIEVYSKGVEIAAAKGDLMPLKDMQTRLAVLK